jgi:hypothetical protein
MFITGQVIKKNSKAIRESKTGNQKQVPTTGLKLFFIASFYHNEKPLKISQDPS